MRPATALAALVLTASLATDAAAERVLEVRDGDSLVVEVDGRRVEIRVSDIDAPEHDQPHGPAARRALARLVERRDVKLSVRTGDAYKRIVAGVRVGNVDVAEAMIRDGHAWVFRRFVDDGPLVELEARARRLRKGLWRRSSPVPPWEWRDQRRNARSERRASNAYCGQRRSCAALASCAEAREVMRRCPGARVDGDGDGIPCEKLCR